MFGGKSNKDSYNQIPSTGPYRDDDDGTNNNYTDRSIQAQQQMLKEQDAGLELLSQSAERLGQMSMSISEELNSQNTLLNEMDTDLESADQNMDMVTQKTKEIIQKAGGKKNCILIATLSAVAIVLFFLVLYT